MATIKRSRTQELYVVDYSSYIPLAVFLQTLLAFERLKLWLINPLIM